jgi:Mg/Co/Ni transporter MgtE
VGFVNFRVHQYGLLSSRNLWPLAGIICFAIVIFMIAAVIVLALIPVYAGKRDLQPNPNSQNGKNVQRYLFS